MEPSCCWGISSTPTRRFWRKNWPRWASKYTIKRWWGDNPERLKTALGEAFSRCDLVLTTGGLGPTYDDLTKETVAQYFGREMVTTEEQLTILKNRFAALGHGITETT